MSGQLRCSRLRRGLLASVILFAPLATATTGYTQTTQKRVLVLYSIRRDGQFAIIGERELPRMLDAGLARNVDYYAEFINLARSPEPGYTAAFSEFLRQKYRDVRFDLVIAMQDSAVGFINDYGDALFSGTPVVFLTNTPVKTHRANSTGLILELDFGATVAFSRQLQPDVQHLFVVTGAAAPDRVYEAAVRRQLQSLADSGLTVSYLSGLAMADLEARLSHLPAHSAVYYVIVSSDPAGARPHPLNYLDRLAAIANAPTYSWVDSTMGHGIVGGSLYSQTAAIQQIGKLALRVLSGEAADSIAAVPIDVNSYEVDWRQIRRWRIDERRVPVGTLIRFREPSVWDQYRRYILAAATLFAMQTALIAGLLIQRTRRRRAEEIVRSSQDALMRSHERNRHLAARLLQAQEAERSRIAGELHDDICQRMLLLTIELDSLAQGNDDGAAAAALVTAQDISKSLRELSHQLHPTRLRVLGLVAGLESLCGEMSRAGLTLRWTHDNVPAALSSDVRLCLFRVAQEALQNAIKHSRATELAMDLSGTSDGLTLTVVDNGVGFDVDAAWKTGIGLGSMSEHLQAVGGSLTITSRPEHGTRLVAIVRRQIL